MSSVPKITVHWLNNSRAQRILWLLEELELPYDIKMYQRDKKTMLAPKELKEVHPLGHSPVVTFEEANGKTVTLAESGAIVEFIIERYGKGKLGVSASADPEKRSQYLYWLHFAEGTAMMPLIFSIVLAQMPKQAPWIARPLVSIIASQVMAIFVKPRLLDNFGLIEQQLANKKYFLGDELTGADIMNIFVIESVEAALGWEKYPNAKAWFERVQQLPAYKKAIEKGGENDLGAFTR